MSCRLFSNYGLNSVGLKRRRCGSWAGNGSLSAKLEELEETTSFRSTFESMFPKSLIVRRFTNRKRWKAVPAKKSTEKTRCRVQSSSRTGLATALFRGMSYESNYLTSHDLRCFLTVGSVQLQADSVSDHPMQRIISGTRIEASDLVGSGKAEETLSAAHLA
jgi:hypothetical protein